MRVLLAAFAALFALATTAFAFDLGPKVGAQTPSRFETADGLGRPASFDSLKGEKGLIVVFSRSVDWCPYCQRQAIDLQQALPELERRGYNLAMITTDTADEVKAFAERRAIAYRMLPDPESKLVDAFGLRDPAYPPGHRVHGVPVPAIFVLSPSGEVMAKLGDLDYRVRPTTEMLLATLDGMK